MTSKGKFGLNKNPVPKYGYIMVHIYSVAITSPKLVLLKSLLLYQLVLKMTELVPYI